MINRNVLMLTLLGIVAAAAVAIQNRSSAQAQATGARRWEYCAITNISTRWRNGADQVTESFAVITYFGTTGIRLEEVGGREYSGGYPDAATLQAASGKAIAKLGAEGWEFVGNENLDFSHQNVGGLLFKRPL